MVKASAIIARLMDDTVSHEFEQKRCGISQGEAEVELRGWVFDAWKDMNEGCLLPTEVPMQVLAQFLNLTRVVDFIYKDEDNYTNAGTKLRNYVESMLIELLTM